MAETQYVKKEEVQAKDEAKKEDETPAAEEPEEKLTRPVFCKVDELSPASVGFNLVVKVGKIKPIMNRLNLDGTSLKISEAIIGDATACVILSLRNDQIDMVNNGYMRVAIDRWGLIEKVVDDQMPDEMKLDNNLSEVEYELVKEPSGGDMGRRGRNG